MNAAALRLVHMLYESVWYTKRILFVFIIVDMRKDVNKCDMANLLFLKKVIFQSQRNKAIALNLVEILLQ